MLLSWGLLASLVVRNKLLVQGGDNLLLLLLFWGLFLPLGARYSVDAAVNRTPPKSSMYWSMATTALIVQLMAVYFFSALLKSGPEWIPNGTAIAYALHLDYFVRPLGVWLREFPTLTQGATYHVWYLELLAPWLIACPFWFKPLRWITLILLAGLHLGIAATMNVGLFFMISIVGLIVFVPASGWNWIQEKWDGPSRGGRGLTLYYDGNCEFCHKACLILITFLRLQHARLLPAPSEGDVGKIMMIEQTWVVEDSGGGRHLKWDALVFLSLRSPFNWLGRILGAGPFRRCGHTVYRFIASHRLQLGTITRVLCPYHSSTVTLGREMNVTVGFLLLYVLYINIQGLPIAGPQWAHRFGLVRNLLSLSQRWDMFTPAPPKFDVWYAVRGELIDGRIVDVLRGTEGEPKMDPPFDVNAQYPTFRWEKYLSRLALASYQPYRPAYANYLCRRWNDSHDPSSRLKRLWLNVITETNELDRQPTRQETLLVLIHTCP